MSTKARRPGRGAGTFVTGFRPRRSAVSLSTGRSDPSGVESWGESMASFRSGVDR